jgi:hypothetical protein
MIKRKREEYFNIVNNYFGDFKYSSIQQILQERKSDLKKESDSNQTKKINLSEYETKNLK